MWKCSFYVCAHVYELNYQHCMHSELAILIWKNDQNFQRVPPEDFLRKKWHLHSPINAAKLSKIRWRLDMTFEMRFGAWPLGPCCTTPLDIMSCIWMHNNSFHQREKVLLHMNQNIFRNWMTIWQNLSNEYRMKQDINFIQANYSWHVVPHHYDIISCIWMHNNSFHQRENQNISETEWQSDKVCQMSIKQDINFIQANNYSWRVVPHHYDIISCIWMHNNSFHQREKVLLHRNQNIFRNFHGW